MERLPRAREQGIAAANKRAVQDRIRMTRALSLLMLSTMAFTSSALLPTVTKSLRRVGVGRRAATAMMSSSSALDIPSLTLANGRSHPMLGYGTYKVGFIPASASAAAAGSEASGATEVTARWRRARHKKPVPCKTTATMHQSISPRW